MIFHLEEWHEGHWRRVEGAFGNAIFVMVECDRDGQCIPRRIVDEDGTLIASGRWCARDTPVNDIKPFSIVMSLDKPGPCERDGLPYYRHPSQEAATTEARRLSQACGGGRFGVLELVHVSGWIDMDLDKEIPF